MRRYDDLPFRVTERQQRRIAEDTALIAERYDIHDSLPEIAPRPEYRAGRGHDLVVMWAGGDDLQAVAHINPYGNGPLSVMRWELIHSDSDDECDCDHCTAERES